jgi:DNA-binding PadR family transcriptional regulator
MKEAALREGGGFSMGPGTLYGSLDRMMRAGLIDETTTTDDERCRYYRLTRFGSKVLEAELLRLGHAIRSARSKFKLGVAHP